MITSSESVALVERRKIQRAIAKYFAGKKDLLTEIIESMENLSANGYRDIARIHHRLDDDLRIKVHSKFEKKVESALESLSVGHSYEDHTDNVYIDDFTNCIEVEQIAIGDMQQKMSHILAYSGRYASRWFEDREDMDAAGQWLIKASPFIMKHAHLVKAESPVYAADLSTWVIKDSIRLFNKGGLYNIPRLVNRVRKAVNFLYELQDYRYPYAAMKLAPFNMMLIMKSGKEQIIQAQLQLLDSVRATGVYRPALDYFTAHAKARQFLATNIEEDARSFLSECGTMETLSIRQRRSLTNYQVTFNKILNV